MLTLEQKIDLLLQRDIVRTQFETVLLGQSFVQGQPIGSGGCRAVILQLNGYVVNGEPTDLLFPLNSCARVYYGDRTRQLYELTSGVANGVITGIDMVIPAALSNRSEIIFCRDLSEVYVRRDLISPNDEPDENFEPFIQVLIYHGRDTEDTYVQMNNGN